MTVLIALTLIAFTAATATLAFSVAAKLADWETTSAVWPIRGMLRRAMNPTTVIGLEVLVLAVAIVPVGVRLRIALLGAVYAGYAVTAALLRGRDCGCFGGRWPSRFTGVHVTVCAVVALAILPSAAYPRLVQDTGAAWVSGIAGSAIVLGLVSAAVLASRRATLPDSRIDSLPPVEVIEQVVIYTSTMCTFCAALLQQESHYRAMAGCPVEFRDAESELDQQRAGHGYPAGVAFNANGEPLYGPVHGMGRIRDLLRHTATVEAPL